MLGSQEEGSRPKAGATLIECDAFPTVLRLVALAAGVEDFICHLPARVTRRPQAFLAALVAKCAEDEDLHAVDAGMRLRLLTKDAAGEFCPSAPLGPSSSSCEAVLWYNSGWTAPGPKCSAATGVSRSLARCSTNASSAAAGRAFQLLQERPNAWKKRRV